MGYLIFEHDLGIMSSIFSLASIYDYGWCILALVTVVIGSLEVVLSFVVHALYMSYCYYPLHLVQIWCLTSHYY